MAEIALNLSTEQVINLVQQLPPDEQARGQDWDALDDDALLALVDDLIHEDRA
jgi:hypothetical protein